MVLLMVLCVQTCLLLMTALLTAEAKAKICMCMKRYASHYYAGASKVPSLHMKMYRSRFKFCRSTK